MHNPTDAPVAAGLSKRFTQAASGRVGAVTAGALLVALTVVIYLPALHAGFVWDDAEYVTDNPTLRTFGGLLEIWLQPSVLPQYYPLTFTTFWIEYHLWGLQPFGYHLVNVLLHALAAVALWQVLRRLRVPGAWLAAAIFAAHPIQVESVAWITERKNVLSGFFVFSALLLFLRATAIDRPAPPASLNWRLYGAACVLFAAALLSKTTACALPAAVLLLAWWKHGAIEQRVLWLIAPLLALGMLMAAGTMAVERHYVEGAEWTRSLAERGLVAGHTFWFYLRTLLWPRSLAFIYPRWPVDPRVWWQYLFPAAAALAIAGLYLGRRRIGRGPVAAALCYGCVLAPVSGFFNVYFMRYTFVADRFAYLPSVAVIAAATAVGTVLALRAGRTGRIAGVVTSSLLLCGMGFLTARQCGLYRSPRTLWADTVAKNPQSWIAHNNLGVLLAQDGDTDAALEQYHAAAQLQPAYPETYLNIGNALQANGKFDDAAKLYALALRVQPAYPMVHYNLGLMLANQGKIDDAINEYTEALRESPDYVEAHNSLGAAFAAQQNFDRAVAEFTIALQLRPDSAETHYNLAAALSAEGRLGEAVTQYETALQLRPDDVEAHVNLGNVLQAQGKPDQAAAHYEAAVRLRPGSAEARNGLGVALAEQGHLAEAIGQLEEAVRVKPDYPEAHSNLGNALQARGALTDAIAQYEAALQLRPTYAEALNNLGMALTAEGKPAEAIAQFEKAVQASPALLQAHKNLASALMNTGRYGEAVAQYESVLQASPADGEARRQVDAARRALHQHSQP